MTDYQNPSQLSDLLITQDITSGRQKNVQTKDSYFIDWTSNISKQSQIQEVFYDKSEQKYLSPGIHFVPQLFKLQEEEKHFKISDMYKKYLVLDKKMIAKQFNSKHQSRVIDHETLEKQCALDWSKFKISSAKITF